MLLHENRTYFGCEYDGRIWKWPLCFQWPRHPKNTTLHSLLSHTVQVCPRRPLCVCICVCAHQCVWDRRERFERGHARGLVEVNIVMLNQQTMCENCKKMKEISCGRRRRLVEVRDWRRNVAQWASPRRGRSGWPLEPIQHAAEQSPDEWRPSFVALLSERCSLLFLLFLSSYLSILCTFLSIFLTLHLSIYIRIYTLPVYRSLLCLSSNALSLRRFLHFYLFISFCLWTDVLITDWIFAEQEWNCYLCGVRTRTPFLILLGSRREMRCSQREVRALCEKARTPLLLSVYRQLGDYTMLLWDVETMKRTNAFRGHRGSVKSVHFKHADPSRSFCRKFVATSYLWCAGKCYAGVFASGARDGNIMIWDTRAPSQMALDVDGGRIQVRSPSVSSRLLLATAV